MKFLVLSVCLSLVAAAPQGFFGLQAHPNGAVTPIDEPAVAAARAEHFAAKGFLPVAAPALAYAAGPAPAVAYTAGPAFPGYAPAYGYSGPLNLNTQLVAHPNGAVVPLDEPAVATARAEHLALKPAVFAAPALGPAFPAVPAGPYAAGFSGYAPTYGFAGPLNLNTQLVAHPNGAVVPLDEPAVAAARADHLAAKGVVGGLYAGFEAGVYAPHAALVAHPNGAVVPVDEPAVQAARADHLALLG